MDDGSRERALWRSVIAQAYSDACMSIRSKDNDQMTQNDLDRAAARRWLLGNSKDFREVCHLADLDPDAVRDRAQTMSRRGWPAPETRKQHRAPIAA